MRDLEEHPLEIEGAWIRICCKLWWSETKGRLTKTLSEWARILRNHPKKTEGYLQYLLEKKICDGEYLDNQNITIVSRRMEKDERIRQIRREVGKLGGNPGLMKIRKNLDNQNSTKASTKSASLHLHSSSSINKNIIEQFKRFWKIYPSRNGRKVTKKESLLFFKDNFKTEEEINLLLKATQNYSAMTKEGFARDAIRFLKKDFWRDWIEKTEDKEYEEVTGVGSGNKY